MRNPHIAKAVYKVPYRKKCEHCGGVMEYSHFNKMSFWNHMKDVQFWQCLHKQKYWGNSKGIIHYTTNKGGE